MTVHETVEQIYEAERGYVYSYLLHLRVPRPRAQELTQDCFVKLYLKMENGEVVDHPRAWLYRVAHHLALRVHQREPVFDELDPEASLPQLSGTPEQEMIDREQEAALTEAVRNLSPQQRNCFYLRVQGLRYREIAEATGISKSAVAEFLRRAVVRLKEAINEA